MNYEELLERLKECLGQLAEPGESSSFVDLAIPDAGLDDLVRVASFDLPDDLTQEESGQLALLAIRVIACRKNPEELSLLVKLLAAWDESEDEDVSTEELTLVFHQYGSLLLPEIESMLSDESSPEVHRMVILEALENVPDEDIPQSEVQQIVKSRLKKLAPERLVNAALIALLLEHEVKDPESQTLILDAYRANVVDVTMNGDLQEVEMALGLREEREEGKGTAENVFELEERFAVEYRRAVMGPVPRKKDPEEILDYFIQLFERPQGVTDFAMLDAILLILITPPEMPPPATMIHLVWDCQTASPEEGPVFEGLDEAQTFSTALQTHYNRMIEDLDQGRYTPAVALVFPEGIKDSPRCVAGTWAMGLLYGATYIESTLGANQFTQEVKDLSMPLLACSVGGQSLDESEAAEALAPAMRFFHQARQKQQGSFGGGGIETVIRQDPKVGRNDPCPCGSGRKYKKCCAN